MLTPEIEKISAEFNLVIEPLTTRSSFHKLDGSWLSLRSLELLLFPLRTINGQVQQDTEISLESKKLFVQGASVYLGKIVYSVWKDLGLEPVLELKESKVVISGVVPQRFFQTTQANLAVLANIEEDLERFLNEVPDPFPILDNFSRLISYEDFYLPLYVFGLCSCFGFHLQTELKKLLSNPEIRDDFIAFVSEVVKSLAKQCVATYERLFPTESLGQVSELYLKNLIFPLEFMQSNITATFGVQGLFEFFNEYQVPNKQILSLTHNLALLGDEVISNAACAYHIGINDNFPSAKFYATCFSRGPRQGLLRNAVYHVRKTNELEVDWIFADKGSSYNFNRVELELVMGLFPWIKFAPEEITNDKRRDDGRFVSLLVALSNFDLQNAKNLSDKYLEEEPGDILIGLQRVFLDMLSGEVDIAASRAKRLLTEPGAEKEARLYDMLGSISFSLGEMEKSLSYHQKAYQIAASKGQIAYDIFNNYAWALASIEQFDKSIDVFEQAEKIHPAPISAMINKAAVLYEIGALKELDQVEEKLIDLAPLDPTVFGNIVFR